MKQTANSCRNCRWAQLPVTGGKLPRFAQLPGRCTYIVPMPIIPKANPDYPVVERLNYKTAIWARDPYTNCPAWAAKE